MGSRHSRLAAALAAAWEAEVVSARILSELADRAGDVRLKARLLVLAAFCRAHASRLLARLSAMGRGPMPVPPEELEIEPDLRLALAHEAAAARNAAQRYEEMAETARAHADYSSAWVCELNRAEEEDRASELGRLAQEPPEVVPSFDTGLPA
jgi:bacterioferritin (cytochrome b1)